MRYTSQGCNCSFSYDITCPQLKVPNKPQITCPAAGCILTGYGLAQRGNAIWAFGDTLSAVNGIVTGADSALDAACTHACCFTRCQPCVEYNLCTCPEVYDNVGTYYHRIRYVTASYEVSDFSDPGCFCIGLTCYCSRPCNLEYNVNNINNCPYTCGSCQVIKCIIFESSVDSDFATIANTVTCTGSCLPACDNVVTSSGLNPDSNGTYLSAGSTIYSRVCTVGGYNCDETSVSPVSCHTVPGCLYVFALCDGANSENASAEGCCCIQLYSIYQINCGFGGIPAQGMCFKYDVSPFCDFCSDIVTRCGPYNVFIKKTELAGGGACPNYYVRSCVLGTSSCLAPQFVRCVNLGNVTRTCITAWCNNPDCNYGRCCAGTINWPGKIVLFEVGGGGVGSITLGLCCSQCSGGGGYVTSTCSSNLNPNAYECIWKCLKPGVSGCLKIVELENKNGCCYFLLAGHGHCGSLRDFSCSYGCSSYMCICGDSCYCTGEATCGVGGMCGVVCPSAVTCTFPIRCIQIETFNGKSGNILCLDSETTRCNIAATYFALCYSELKCMCTDDKICTVGGLGTTKCGFFAQLGLRDSDVNDRINDCFRDRRTGHWCGSNDMGSMTCECGTIWSRPFSCEERDACFCDREATGKPNPHMNLWGLGGFAARICVKANCGTQGYGCICGVCNPTQGFGYGAGGPSFSYQKGVCAHASSEWLNNEWCCDLCYPYSGQAGVCSCESGVKIWPGNCCSNIGCSCPWALRMPSGGSAGILFLCNEERMTIQGFGYWRSRPGLVAFACQDYA